MRGTAVIQNWIIVLRRNFHRLQWLHSIWALLLGIGVMFFFQRDFKFVRLILGYLLLIWIASLILHWESERFGLTEESHPKVRRIVLYMIQNFYHEMLFFLLPLYYLSTTFPSRNMLFFIVVVACALVASFDVVYWKWMIQRGLYFQVFYALVLFSCFNIFIPVLTGIRNGYSLYIAGALACLGFATLNRPPREWFSLQSAFRLSAGMVVSMGLLFLLKSFIPPSPIYLLDADFGLGFDRQSFSITGPVRSAAQLGSSARIYALAAVKAPLGIYERVSVKWYRNGEKVSEGRVVELAGGREKGFRLWSGLPLADRTPAQYRIDVTTESGQLIGRAVLPAR
jgi:hypothetical protein